MIEDILCEDHIQLFIDPKDWRSAISIAAKPLVEKGYIDLTYVDAMIDSVVEYGPYIVITENLALAHARPENGVKKLGLSVATLKNEILFGDKDQQEVRIVFCLAATDAHSHLNIMKSLITIINSAEKISKLINCNNIVAFKKLVGTEEERV